MQGQEDGREKGNRKMTAVVLAFDDRDSVEEQEGLSWDGENVAPV